MITVKDLTKRYARTTAVDNISFEVGKGQIVGFLGPNGAGKTTTMRILTCFLPPTAGTAQVAGFDVLEQPLRSEEDASAICPKRRPIYPEMEIAEYLKFVGRLKGLSGAKLQKRVDYVCDRCAVADVKKKLIGKLSKGYRQRVGLAQAIIHNPDVLILDEPTSGLDPKQINETRELIKDLAGDHTIILSTHILPEVEQTCQQVIIINKGKLVATDSVRNLQARARGAETVVLEIAGRTADLKLPSCSTSSNRWPASAACTANSKSTVALSSRSKATRAASFAATSPAPSSNAGWDLNELRPSAMSLEEIFLELTGRPARRPQEDAQRTKERSSNEKHLGHLPQRTEQLLRLRWIAYLLLTMFAVIFGFFFWNLLAIFVCEGIEMQMRGQTIPMNINEQIIRPLLSERHRDRACSIIP